MTGFASLTDAPLPAPPKSSKNDIYHNLTANQVFNDLDDYVVNVSSLVTLTFLLACDLYAHAIEAISVIFYQLRTFSEFITCHCS